MSNASPPPGSAFLREASADVRQDTDRWSRAREALLEDEARRTHGFLALTGLLALVGVLAAYLLDGDPAYRTAFAVSVAIMELGYLALWWHTRELARYSPAKAVAVITVCNFAGVLACFYYGFFSPAPMILLLPIAYIGRSASGWAAWGAYSFAASSIATPMTLVALGRFSDPGIVTGASLDVAGRLLYTALVQAVFLICLLNARSSRRATATAVRALAGALQRIDERESQLEEINAQLDEALRTGRDGPRSGQRLGDWELGGLLGRGASGDVYAARRDRDRAEAAVKVLNPLHETDPASLAMLAREAELVRRIRSAHVVGIIDFATDHPPWVAFERLRGEMLSDRLRRQRRLSTTAVVRMASEVGLALDAAASLDIVHRDLKPGNICLAVGAEGHTTWKLLDFGVGQFIGEDLTLTARLVLGTPGYIPPEVIAGEGVDARGDIFSLAAVTYRALTGARPFRGRDRALLASTAREQPVRPSAWPGVDAAFDDVLAVGLAKRPLDRFATAGEFADSLQRAAEGAAPAGVARRAAAILRADPWRPSAPDGVGTLRR